MPELSARMELIKSQLAAKYPARVVTRDFVDFPMRAAADLEKGVYTLISRGEGGYQNHNGREAMDGKHNIGLIGQIQVGEEASASAVEDAEFAMLEEIKAFVRALPIELCTLVMKDFAQSSQLEHPFGWIAVEMEFLN